MKISELTSFNNPPVTFGIKKLFKAKLKQTMLDSSTRDVDVYISLLENSDKKKFNELLPILRNTTYGREILNEFNLTVGSNRINYSELMDKKYKFVIIEKASNDNSTFISKILSMSDATVGKSTMHLAHLESLKRTGEKISGAGSCIIYALSKIAQEQKQDAINVYSGLQAINFYKNLFFMHKPNNSICFLSLNSDKFNDLQKTLENKYSITPYLNKK